ncbi:MAG: 3-deoxy-8-phosphooctulonate synthase [Ignavibacteria bacterium]|nr:3-deoxy-8-phosphooctulonate synthase [Ignavibacteria bacterium]
MNKSHIFDSIFTYLGFKKQRNFLLIAGPCVIENKSVVFKTCEHIKNISAKYNLPFVFKSSYIKANRTSGKSFRGIGMEKALQILVQTKKEFSVPVLTDIHSEFEAGIAAEVADIIQIPAFLCRQTELLEAAGETGKIINIKKGQFMSPEDMKYQAEKVASTGNNKILFTERGTFFGYNNLVVDMRSIIIMKKFGYPVIFDGTHSVQMPSANKGVSGGKPEFIEPLSKAAVSAGADGLFIETHPEPMKALSDGSNMLKLDKFELLVDKIVKLINLKF